MTRNNNYHFPPQEELVRIRKKLSDPNYEGGNILIAKDAPTEEKIKHSISQSILTYQQESKKSFADLVKEIDISTLTEKQLIDICRGKLTDFTWPELVIYANNLRVTFIPCYQCGLNVFPNLLEYLVGSFKKQTNSLPKQVSQIHAHF